MYESHFGITGPPFQLSPDPSFYFDSKGHHKALAEIRRGLAEKTGFVVVSGEVGAGKTTLVRTLLEEMDSSRYAIGQILSTQLDADELLRAILLAFGVAPADESPDKLMAAVHRQAAALAKDGWRAVLIIDEAQNLHADAFHRLVELDRDGAPGRTPLKVFLVGQPELRTLIASHELTALRERVRVSCHLGPLDAVETGAYIQHRLAKVGWSGVPRFDAGAFAEIHRWTQGIPRRVNLLCNRLMLSRFLSAEVQIDAATVATTARDLRTEIGDTGPEPRSVQEAGTTAPVALNAAIEPITLTELVEPAATTETASTPLAGSLASVVPSVPRAEKPVAATAPLPAPAPAAVPSPPPARATPKIAAPAVRPASQPAAADIAPPVLKRDRRRPETLPPQLPPMQVQSDGSGPLLCMLGSNADHIKAAALIAALAQHPGLPATLLVRVNGSDGASDVVERNRELFSDVDRSRLINLGLGDGTEVGRAAELMKRFEFVIDHCEPGAVIVFDASEAALHAGLVARSKRVPVVHIGAGLRSRDGAARADVPRKLTDHLSDVLYTAEEDAGANLLREGVPTDRVCFVGNLLVDALQIAMRSPLDALSAADELGDARHYLSDAHGYGLVTIDALANVSERQTLTELVTILRQVSRDLPLIWPMSARTRHQLAKFRLDAFIADERIACVPTQRHAVYARLLSSATCVLSDSWNVQEEASALGIPCMAMGVEPGRPMAVGVGSGITVGKNKTLATRAVWECIFNGGKRGRVPDRWDGQTAGRIATHLAAWLVAERARRAA